MTREMDNLKQPEALRLADALENTPNWQKEEWSSNWKDGVMHFSREPFEAAAELRRLHQYEEAHEIWLEKTEWVQQTRRPGEFGHRADALKARITALETANAELLEALRSLMFRIQNDLEPGADWAVVEQQVARAAIAKHGGAHD